MKRQRKGSRGRMRNERGQRDITFFLQRFHGETVETETDKETKTGGGTKTRRQREEEEEGLRGPRGIAAKPAREDPEEPVVTGPSREDHLPTQD